MQRPFAEFEMSFAVYKQLQSYMGGRVFRKNKRRYLIALIGVVLCAGALAMAIVFNLHPYMAMRYFGAKYPESVYLALITCLALAIIFLMPGVALRKDSLRMQVNAKGPLFGPTRISLEDDGILVQRRLMTAKYLWFGIQGIEQTNAATVIAIDNGIGLIIPDSGFASTTAKYEFLAALSEKVTSTNTGCEKPAASSISGRP